MLKRILLATDFGPRSRRAEEQALWLARITGASCLLLHVIEALRGDPDEEMHSIYADLERRLHGRGLVHPRRPPARPSRRRAECGPTRP